MMQAVSRHVASLTLGLSLVALGACGGASKPATPVIGAKGGAAVATVPCPPEAELADALRARWALTNADVDTTCTPGRFPQAGWAISAVVDLSEDEAWDRIVVMAASDRAVIAESEQHAIPPWARNEGYGGALFEVVDFDGDGVDELTSRGSENHGGTDVAWLAVERLSGRTIAQALWLQTHYDNAAEVGPEEAVECNVDATIVAQGASQIVVAVGTVTSPGDAPSDCFVGRREYRLSGDTFVHAP
ncbi:MAG: hypothetical protein IPH80_41130 [Myxococcales bacterium]|nr:hypothetical protein [Myxococcales bacterium]